MKESTQKIDTRKQARSMYKKYSYDARLKLIKMVKEEKIKPSKVAKQLGICPTTARLILSTWNEEGRVFQKKNQKDKRLRKEEEKKAKEERKNLMKEKQRLRKLNKNKSEAIPNIKVEPEDSEANIIENIAQLEIKVQERVPEAPQIYQASQIQNNEMNNYYNSYLYYCIPYAMPLMPYY